MPDHREEGGNVVSRLTPTPEGRRGAIRGLGMWRGSRRVADVVVLTSGKCIVAWPNSVIVYDSEQEARAVHITHMGGRGEETGFVAETVTPCSVICPAGAAPGECGCRMVADRRYEAVVLHDPPDLHARLEAAEKELLESRRLTLAQVRRADRAVARLAEIEKAAAELLEGMSGVGMQGRGHALLSDYRAALAGRTP